MTLMIKEILVTSKPDTSNLDDMIAFSSLYDSSVNSSQHILQCGFIDNVF
ncbi:hypothetical protein [Acinetobacter dispersus]|nr:hypothetical protein [Acinetobacter dispersus]